EMGMFQRRRDPEREEFEAEVLPHLDVLYANGMRLTHSPSDAEDLAQETILRAYRFFDRFERGSNIKAWLLRIQYNTFVNRYRRRTKERDITEAMAQEPAGEGVISRETLRGLSDPVGTALRPVVVREIGAALDELPEEHRMVVVLADVEELSYKEIAEILGCPIGTVMSRLHRARRALRKRLLEHAQQHGLSACENGAPDAADPVSLERYRRDRSGT
ncbi:MAG: sigma-70 family RNA polymerase sigma factor, partial [Myxococcales bacterium]|nr:sigma-70 family RNA polymerase sigma factor [Myxococcales bacterium]